MFFLLVILGLRGEDMYTFFCLYYFYLDGKLRFLHQGWLHISSEVNFTEVTSAFVTFTWVSVPFYL